jgi:hypothetical protein
MYERNEKLYRHKIFQMQKVMPSFQYELLVLIPEPKTLNEEEDRENIDGAKPSEIKIEKEELTNVIEGRDSFHKEVDGMKYALKQIFKP